MSRGTLYDKVWDRHTVATLPDGRDQLFVGLHLLHEVTSPQAFAMLRERGIEVAHPERTVATTDHVVPTEPGARDRPLADDSAEEMVTALERNTDEHGITTFGTESGRQGITHVIAPELGLSQPGMTVACGDSHTPTHGAFGAIGIGVGTTQIRDLLATGCLAAEKADVRRVEIEGSLERGVTAKDLSLRLIQQLGVDGGVGYVYEYGGSAVREMEMAGRLAVCNMSIEAGARAGYVEPDQTTYDYLRGRPYVPDGEAFEDLRAYWESIRSEPDATYDDRVRITVDDLAPMVTWGTNPGQAVQVTAPVPAPAETDDPEAARHAQEHMSVTPGQTMDGYPVDVAFLGTCTNGRVADFARAASVLEGQRVASDVRALAVPGSETVRRECEQRGIADTFRAAGFDWRQAGCSMCLAMNGDAIEGSEACISSSNRNFVGRQGSKHGRTVLASPETVAAAAVAGEVTDVRRFDHSSDTPATGVAD